MIEPLEIEVTCEQGHRQVIELNGYSFQGAEGLAGLLDGTSPVYKYPPADYPDSPIGKCGICGKSIKAKVSRRRAQ